MFFYNFSSGTDDGSIRFWRLDTGAGESVKAHENTVTTLAAYRDRQGSLTLASAGFDGVIVVWRAHAKDGVKTHTVSGFRLCLPGCSTGTSSSIPQSKTHPFLIAKVLIN